jgi:SNF2 family DNA or RNA helicase
MKAVLHDNAIRVYSEYAEKDIVKTIPGVRWDKEGRFWWAPATPSYARRISDLPINGPLSFEFWALVRQADNRQRPPSERESFAINTKTSSWKHQIKATIFSYYTDVGLLDMWMGTGKSKAVIDLIATEHPASTLIICPKTVIPVWPQQIEKHSAIQLIVFPLAGSSTQKANWLQVYLYEQTTHKPNDCLVIITNYDSVWRGKLGKVVLEKYWDLVVFDESHRIKAPDGRASKFCAEIKAKKKLALTGTPMPHSPLDIFGQYRALDCGLFGTSFRQFRERYAILEEKETRVICRKCRGTGASSLSSRGVTECPNCGGSGKVTKTYQAVVGYQHEDELRAIIDSIRFTAGPEVLDLPPLNVVDVPITLQKASRTAYDALQSEMVASVAGNTITAENALVKLLRLQQITSGFVSTDTQNSPKPAILQNLGTEKAEALADYFQDIGEPVIVFCRFKHDIAVIQQVARDLGIGSCQLSGDLNELDWWQKGTTSLGGRIQVLAVQIQAGGVGIDLTRARYAIYFSLGLSLGDYQQTIARLHRPGQARPVTVYRLLTVNTVDEKIAKALDEKKEVVDAILREFRLKG